MLNALCPWLCVIRRKLHVFANCSELISASARDGTHVKPTSLEWSWCNVVKHKVMILQQLASITCQVSTYVPLGSPQVYPKPNLTRFMLFPQKRCRPSKLWLLYLSKSFDNVIWILSWKYHLLQQIFCWKYPNYLKNRKYLYLYLQNYGFRIKKGYYFFIFNPQDTWICSLNQYIRAFLLKNSCPSVYKSYLVSLNVIAELILSQ